MAGSPQVISCTVNTVSGVVSSSVIISWMRPGGAAIISDNRMAISSTTTSASTYTSSLKFTYLMEGDEGMYTCNVTILKASVSQSIELQSLTCEFYVYVNVQEFIQSRTKLVIILCFLHI